MTRHALAAFAALALWGCGGLDESEVAVDTAVQAMVAEEPPPPVSDKPQRLSTEELFQDTAPVVASPQDPTFADQYYYRVGIPRGPGCR